MSTKTTFKRIALVAVAALGLGVLSSVAPASAAQGRQSVAISIGSGPFKTGVFNYIPVTITMGTDWVMGDSVTVTAQITDAPIQGGPSNAPSLLGIGSAANSNADGARFKFASTAVGAAAGTPIVTGGASDVTAVTAGNSSAGNLEAAGALEDDNAGGVSAAAYNVISTTANTTASGVLTVWLGIKPDVAGTYSVLVGTNDALDPSYDAGDTRATASFTTSGTVASVAVTTLNTSPLTGADAKAGVIFKAVLKDSAGNATSLGALDTVTFTSSDSNDTFTSCVNASNSAFSANCAASMTSGVAVAANFINGVGYFKVANAGTASTVSTITATSSIVGGTTSVGTASATFKKMTDLGDISVENQVTEGKGGTTGYSGTASSTTAWTQTVKSTATSTALKYTLGTGTTTVAALAALTATGYTYIEVTDATNKVIFGSDAPGAINYLSTCSIGIAATSYTCSVSHSALADGVSANNFTMQAPQTSATIVGVQTTHVTTIAGAAAGTSGTNTLTASPAGPVAATAKGTLTIAATLKDRFGTVIPNAVVTVSVAGRNTVAATVKTTDADGNVSFTYTDAGTVATNDTVTFTNSSSGTATAQVTVSYTTAAVSTVKLSGGNTTLGVANATVTVKAISAGDGAEGGAVAYTAKVADANGSALVGVPVTFSVAGTGVAIPTAEVLVYTDSTGVATSSVYAWIEGTYTVSAVAGGVTGTGTISFGSITATNARVLSATVEGNVVTAKVVDRFGNPVKGVTVYATKTGVGYFGNGLAKTSDTTDAKGVVSFGITGGNAAVTVTTLDPTAPAGTNAYGQTCALAGNLTCASGATAAVAFTASVAGTTLVNEEYVGATFAPAGVSSATLEVTDAASSNASAAADAAAEATDAANAATDAANAAAEAADAATAAAQDAADAVAALSTQVSEMVNALKKQITALTNLVIKIQKKVKA
jgi:trimeric autotransporter adhesin